MTAIDRPRVALLHYAAPPTVGGVEATMAAHARLFASHGYPVKIITGRGETFDPRVPVEIVPEVDSRAGRVLQVNTELEHAVVSEEFDALVQDLTRALECAVKDSGVLIVHNALSLHKNLALTAALRIIAEARRVKMIAWCHDFAWDDPVYDGEMHAGAPWDLIRQPWEGVAYVVVSEARKADLRKLWRADRGAIAVVPPGLDALSFFGVNELTARWTREMGWLDAAPLLLLPARVTRRKNIELAIEIAAALQALGLAPKLVVMGPPGSHNRANMAYLEELRALRRERAMENAVIFLHECGVVDDGTRRDLYLLADGLLFTSTREGFGIPILEAGLTRLPVFCSDIPPFRESADRWAHYISLDESPPVIAKLIAQVLTRDAGYQLKQRVLRQYGWERIFAERIEPLVSGEQTLSAAG